MAKHYIAKQRVCRWANVDGLYGPQLIDPPQWRDCSNRYTKLSLYKSEHAAVVNNYHEKDPSTVQVFLLDTDDLEPVGNVQARMEWAERMMLKCGQLFDQLQREQRG